MVLEEGQNWRDRVNALVEEKRSDEALALCDAVLAANPDTDDAHDAWILKCITFFGQNRNEEALAACERALALDLGSDSAWHAKGAALGRLGRPEEALAAFDHATAIDSTNAIYWEGRGDALRDLKRLEESAEAYKCAVERNPSNRRVWDACGSVLTSLGRWEEALDAFDHALALEPHDLWGLERRAASLYTLNRFEEAIAAYTRLLTLATEGRASIWYWMGMAQHQLRRPAEALTAYDQALALGADDYRIHMSRAAALYNVQRDDEALTEAQLALERDPNGYFAWRVKGKVLSRLRHPSEALDAFEHGLTIEPGESEMLFGRIAMLADLRRNDEALAQCEASQAQLLNDWRFWHMKGVVLYRLKRFKESLAAFDEGLQVAPETLDILYTYAHSLMALKRYDEALSVLDQAQHALSAKAYAAPKTLAAIERTRSSIYCEQGRFDEAIAADQRRVVLTPESADALIDLGNSLFKAGRLEEAIGASDRALALQPNAPMALKNRAAALFRLARYDEALVEYERVIALAPNDAVAWRWKGDTLHRLERSDDAMSAYDEALRLMSDDKDMQEAHDALLPWVRRTVADQRFRLTDGRWLGYLDLGDPDGTPVFYFHGMPGSRLELLTCVPLLKETHIRLIAPDRPGYGLSTYQRRRKILDWPADVVALADHLGIARFAVLGASAGGAYAAACARKIPERLLACGLIASVAPYEAFKGGFEWTRTYTTRAVARFSPMPVLWFIGAVWGYLTKLDPDSAAQVFQLRNQGAVWPQARRTFLSSPTPQLMPVAREIVTEPWRQGGRGYARDNWLSAHAWSFLLQDITIPVHLWHGELDVFSPMLAARYLASHFPDCHPTYYPNGRHDLLDEHGREILTALVAASQERDFVEA